MVPNLVRMRTNQVLLLSTGCLGWLEQRRPPIWSKSPCPILKPARSQTINKTKKTSGVRVRVSLKIKAMIKTKAVAIVEQRKDIPMARKTARPKTLSATNAVKEATMPTCVEAKETLAETEMKEAKIALLNLLGQSGSAKSHIETTTTTTVGIDEKNRDTTIEIVNHGKDLVRDQDMEVAIGEMAANITDQKLIT